jgi:flagellar hook assembly protein FlgD
MGIAVTYDDGANYTPLWQLTDPTGNVGPEQITTTFTATSSPFKLALFFIGNSFNIDYWYVDDIEVTYIIPVELTSFTANSTGKDVTLNWSTATETNNSGFEIQRSNGGEFDVLGFVSGNGTTTQPQSYNFVDKNLPSGKYTYRLKQIDYNGQFEYSPAVEVEVIGVTEYTLHQNYPNPFNPTTSISFDLASDSKVTLRIFDVLGQEVMTVLSGNLSAGSHKIQFNANGLNSGVYFYQIDATGVDGKNFSAVRKMILNK